MDKVVNFRDLGGIPTKNGKTVKPGLFFRSAMLNEASQEDIDYLKSLGLKQIFDYRDILEAELINDDAYNLIGAKHAHYPSDLNNDKLFKLKKASHLSRLFISVTLDDVKNTYRHLPFNNAGYKAMIKAVQDGDVPFLQHCSAGKDRAGLGSALLLALLGVDYDEILKDYLKSGEIKAYLEEKIGAFAPKILRKYLIRRYQCLFIVDKALLDTAIDAIIERYSTLENYFKEEYNLETSDIQDLREKYTQ